MKRIRNSQAPGHAGFTILESMFAIAILAVVLTIATGLFVYAI
ncbi:MAG: prepilin-type N-terminal cleavage/methylation domain-containing protein, partial [Kiritimatiellae bacterium]|nr:prepilin-type N-terminal cleavage/methylation domain-containing protein [Kiritimatiellia bacterium]